jgi:hypothetical protein
MMPGNRDPSLNPSSGAGERDPQARLGSSPGPGAQSGQESLRFVDHPVTLGHAESVLPAQVGRSNKHGH